MSLDNHSPTKKFVNYEVQELIGHGGMAKVYLAKDTRLHRTVALKVIKTGTSSEAARKAVFEAQVLARLNHQNIVQIFDILHHEAEIILVMEHVKGLTLRQYSHQNIPDLLKCLSILYQVCVGLGKAHDSGVIHCDLKPSNILIDNQDNAKISDFGISLLSGKKGFKQSDHGTQAYMSPEQLRGEQLDYRSDLFSFGVMAFTLLAGYLPFPTSHRTQLSTGLKSQSSLMDAHSIVPPIPAALAELINQLIAVQRDERPASACQVAQQIKSILVQETQARILEENTIPVTEIPVVAGDARNSPHPDSHVSRKTFYRSASTVLVLLAFLVAGKYIVQNITRPDTQQLYLLRPVFEDSGKLDKLQQALITASVDNAIRNMSINAKSLRLIPEQLDAETLSIAEIGASTGADQVIRSVLNCNDYHCVLGFSRLEGPDWSVTLQRQSRIPFENLNEVHLTTQHNFAMLFPGVKDAYLEPRKVSAPDYEQYIELYSDIYLQGLSSEENFTKLSALIRRAPYLYAAYGLLRENAFGLSYETNDKRFLDSFSDTLHSAPSEYRHSVFYSIDAFWLAMAQQNFDGALADIRELIARDADASTVLELEAYYFHEQSDFKSATERYQQALSIRPSTKLLYNLALCQRWSGYYSEAIATLQSILELTPEDYATNQQLATLYLLSGELQAAIEIYSEITTSQKQSIDFNNLGLAYVLLGEYLEARYYIQQAVDLAPDNATWLLNLADIELLLQQTDSAFMLYNRVITIHDAASDVAAWLEKAQAFAQTERPLLAAKALNEAKRLAPDSGEVAFTAALVYTILGEYTSAIAATEEALYFEVGTIWFGFPWFDPLCTDSRFIGLMQANGRPDRCTAS